MIPKKGYVLFIIGIYLNIQVQCRKQSNCECGVIQNLNRIVGGWYSNPHQFPWIVPIYNKKSLYCGGSIINNRYILTAGHCVRWTKVSKIEVHVGVHERRRVRPDNVYKAMEFILHPEFYSYKSYDIHDIALIKVTRPITFSDIVYPICLPIKGDSFDNEYATVAGWGQLGEGQGVSNILKETILRVLSQEECKRTKLRSVVTRTTLCAYFDHSDSCQGDSGGPLVIEKIPGKMTQIGIVSWGIGCASPIPGIYTRVSEYLDWIYSSTSDAVYCQN